MFGVNSISCIEQSLSIRGAYAGTMTFPTGETHIAVIKNNDCYYLKQLGDKIECAKLKIRGIHNILDEYDAELEVINKCGDSFEEIGKRKQCKLIYNDSIIEYVGLQLSKTNQSISDKIIDKAEKVLSGCED